MPTTVGIVDYQMGNLRSVQKAIERLGSVAIVSSSPEELSQATHLILPGVGAFGDAMREIESRHLVPFLQRWAADQKPFLGICLGMQLLFDVSFEGGTNDGLGILPGKVLRFSSDSPEMKAPNGLPLKVPHMGWNRVTSRIANDPMLEGIPSAPYVYFVHSYYVVPIDPNDVWLTCDYGIPFCAAVRRGNIMATQFHPEKSQRDGLKIIENFLNVPAKN